MRDRSLRIAVLPADFFPSQDRERICTRRRLCSVACHPADPLIFRRRSACGFLAPLIIAVSFCLRCHVGRDYDPVKGQWFEDLEENEIFQVVSVDPDEELVEIQYENGD